MLRIQRSSWLVAAAVTCLVAAGLLLLGSRSVRPTVPAVAAPRKDLVQRDGRWYCAGTSNPFTGWMVDYYPGGKLRSRSLIANGLADGVSDTWYTNGQLQVREHFKQGLSDGPREKWYPDATKSSQATIVAGKVTGQFQSWYDNGQLNEQISMKSGRPDGVAWAYYPSGYLKAKTLVANGRILHREIWPDGQCKPAP